MRVKERTVLKYKLIKTQNTILLFSLEAFKRPQLSLSAFLNIVDQVQDVIRRLCFYVILLMMLFFFTGCGVRFFVLNIY